LGTVLSSSKQDEKYDEILVKANTGIRELA
jgi:hypothetical protein